VLERLATRGLGAAPQDCRLGDLSEQYVRNHKRLRASLGTAPGAAALARLATDLRYLAAAANVCLFARAVEPGAQWTETGVAALAALDLRERTMTMLRTTTRRLVLPLVLLVASALLINGAIGTWRSWRQTEALMADMQREKAEVAAQRIDAFLRETERQMGWVSGTNWAKMTADQRRFDLVRLLRQTPAITVVSQLDRDGHEQLNVSRLAMDVVGSNVDRSAEPAFKEATAVGLYLGPVYYRKASEPYLTMALSYPLKGGVIVAEVNLKAVWDTIRQVKVGEAGYAYLVDNKGRLISYADMKLVLKEPDLSAKPQVAAALKGPATTDPVEGWSIDATRAVQSTVSLHAAVPRVGWQVFVDVPSSEMQGLFWNAAIRGIALLGLGLVLACLAILVAVRPAVLPSRPSPA
jgi:hypothetical protein